jgi:hypothetical protein
MPVLFFKKKSYYNLSYTRLLQKEFQALDKAWISCSVSQKMAAVFILWTLTYYMFQLVNSQACSAAQVDQLFFLHN